ncbi:hypothetical protein [Blattabacterium cuenoti]|nr:hypothetical protein [Blattabacterium cuenoti]
MSKELILIIINVEAEGEEVKIALLEVYKRESYWSIRKKFKSKVLCM